MTRTRFTRGARPAGRVCAPLRQTRSDGGFGHRPRRLGFHPRARRSRHQGARRSDFRRQRRTCAFARDRSRRARRKARLDVDIDGADEVDPRLNMVKGYGGAMVREKVVACASRKVVILIGAEKRVETSRRAPPVAGRSRAVRGALRDAPDAGVGTQAGGANRCRRERVLERQRQLGDGLRHQRSSKLPRASSASCSRFQAWSAPDFSSVSPASC